MFLASQGGKVDRGERDIGPMFACDKLGIVEMKPGMRRILARDLTELWAQGLSVANTHVCIKKHNLPFNCFTTLPNQACQLVTCEGHSPYRGLYMFTVLIICLSGSIPLSPWI